MLCRKAEILVYIKQAGSITAADEALLDLIHPLAENRLQNYLRQSLRYQQHIEYLPTGDSRGDTDYALEDVSFKPAGAGAIIRSNRPGTDYLQLKHLPVTTFGLEVREDLDARAGQNPATQFADSTILTLGEDYFLDADERVMVDGHSVHLSRSGILRRIGAWAVEPRCVKVTYYAGWVAEQLYNESAMTIRDCAMRTVAAAFWKAKNDAETKGRGPKMSESIGKYSYSVGQQAAIASQVSVPADVINDLQPFRSYRML